jgi:CRP-like cAMP-binding protein
VQRAIPPRRPTTSSEQGLTPSNRLLTALTPAEFERLRSELQTVTIKPKQLIYAAGAAIKDVYFPHDGVYSIVTTLSDGSMVESATIGSEGMLGVEAFVRDDAAAYGHTIVQVPGETAERLPIGAFRREINRHATLARLLGSYLELLVAHMMQSLACNARHGLEQRCCRWLLLIHDRVGTDEFRLSHEFLAMMLGNRRQSVSVVAGALQEQGLIRYKHGRVVLIDRPGLEGRACECYRVMQQQLRRFMTLSSPEGGQFS